MANRLQKSETGTKLFLTKRKIELKNEHTSSEDVSLKTANIDVSIYRLVSAIRFRHLQLGTADICSFLF